MPRIVALADDDLHVRFQKIPWGLRGALLAVLIDKACDVYEQHGQTGLGAILEGNFRINWFVQNLNASEEKKK